MKIIAKLHEKLKKIDNKLLVNDQQIAHYRIILKQLESSEADITYDIADQQALVTLARNLSLRDTLEADLQKNGITYTNKNSRAGVAHVANPSLAALDRCNTAIRQLLKELGMTVQSRGQQEQEVEEEGYITWKAEVVK